MVEGGFQGCSEDVVGRVFFFGSASFILAEKLKALKPLLRCWNKEVFGLYEVQKELALNRVDFWDKKESVCLLLLDEQASRMEARGLQKMGSSGRNVLETEIKGNLVEGGGWKHEVLS